MANTFLVLSAVSVVVAAALTAAYLSGALDPVIKKIDAYFSKGKTRGEEKKMEVPGLKQGKDFVKGKKPYLAWICSD
jgi:hypothetical protein